MKKTLLLLVASIFFLSVVGAQVGFNQAGAAGTYTQDFETFQGTAATIPANWTNSFNDYDPGGFYSNTAVYANNLSVYALNQNGSGEYSIGGKVGASGGLITLTLSGRNTATSGVITGFTVSWSVEQYSTGGRATTSNFSFAGGTTTGTTLTTASTGSNTNLSTVTVTNRSVTISGLNIAVNSTFNFVWNITTGTGSGDNVHLGIDNIVIVPAGTLSLPIDLQQFDARASGASTLLSFSTASERNNSHFEIERSTDAQTFTQIGQVAGAGTSDATQNYTFTDATPVRGANYYRLKQVDFDGNFSYSMIRTVEFGKPGNVLVFPSPTAEILHVQLEETFATDAYWQIIDRAGRIISSGTLAGEQQAYQIPVSALVEGAYVLRIVADQQVLTQQFSKQ